MAAPDDPGGRAQLDEAAHTLCLLTGRGNAHAALHRPPSRRSPRPKPRRTQPEVPGCPAGFDVACMEPSRRRASELGLPGSAW
ncbi:hypothetical protein ACIRBY_31885 [Streptomyces sp. NPDC096136]|uniref:hypothetical protein n=1 Tax=Streptomyces sp. NPDC096136 TaxID=3366076 RepID=UPI003800EF8D